MFEGAGVNDSQENVFFKPKSAWPFGRRALTVNSHDKQFTNDVHSAITFIKKLLIKYSDPENVLNSAGAHTLN